MAPKAIDYWRKFFGSAGVNIFEVIDQAILVAVTDRPEEFRRRRDRFREMLKTALLPRCEMQGVRRGPGPDRSNDSSPAASMIGEIMRMKEILQSRIKGDDHEQPDGDDDEFLMSECLKRLQNMEITVDLLKATEIGKAVNAIRKCRKNSKQIRRLASTVVKGWKVVVDEWLNANTAAIADKSVKTSPQMKPLAAIKVGLKDLTEGDIKAKLEITKRKLHESYERAENVKKQRTIKILEPSDIPRPLAQDEMQPALKNKRSSKLRRT